jgi:hypothetical protein
MVTHHLIFEGSELAGKTWIMSEIYKKLEKKYGRSKTRLDGCFWLNCDFGLLGSEKGKPVIKSYLPILNELKDKNTIIEKFHLTDAVFNDLYSGVKTDFEDEEDELSRLGYKIVLITFKEDENLLAGRIKDRLNLYPHYERVVKRPADYIRQQKEYIKKIKNTKLPYLIVETEFLPDQKPIVEILNWIGE